MGEHGTRRSSLGHGECAQRFSPEHVEGELQLTQGSPNTIFAKTQVRLEFNLVLLPLFPNRNWCRAEWKKEQEKGGFTRLKIPFSSLSSHQIRPIPSKTTKGSAHWLVLGPNCSVTGFYPEIFSLFARRRSSSAFGNRVYLTRVLWGILSVPSHLMPSEVTIRIGFCPLNDSVSRGTQNLRRSVRLRGIKTLRLFVGSWPGLYAICRIGATDTLSRLLGPPVLRGLYSYHFGVEDPRLVFKVFT